jgi:tryptophanase
VFFRAALEPGAIVPSNAFFDTTRAHAELAGARALDLACPEADDTRSPYPFKGNIDLDRLEALLDGPDAARVPFVLVTITNNTGGGQPVSLENLTETAVLARSHGKGLVLDIARYAENAWFIQQHEPGQGERPVAEIVRSELALADVALMSAKKDASVNIGGFVACRDPELHERLKTQLIIFEGFPTYGGLAGRDLEAIAVGLYESVDEELLAHRTGQVAELARCLEEEAGVPVVQPPGGHAVYVDCAGLFPRVAPARFPAQAFVCALYEAGGVRCVEVGSNMAGRDPETGENRHPQLELARLAIPRRTYTASQLDLVVEAAADVAARRDEIHGLEMTWEPADSPALRHFTARFAPVPVSARASR